MGERRNVMNYPVMWLIIFVLLILFEIATLGLTTVWFAMGALVAFFTSVFDANIYVQLTVFVLVSALLLMTTRPLFKGLVNKKTIKTNTDNLIGAIAEVTAPIDNLKACGAAKINGVEWTARSADQDVKFEVGEFVKIKEISGVKLIVEINN